MGKLIDAERLKAHYCWWDNENKEIFDQIVDLQPDAQRHGHWITKRNPMLYQTVPYVKVCSECGTAFPYAMPYCGECGAKMDTGETYEVKDGVRIVI